MNIFSLLLLLEDHCMYLHTFSSLRTYLSPPIPPITRSGQYFLRPVKVDPQTEIRAHRGMWSSAPPPRPELDISVFFHMQSC